MMLYYLCLALFFIACLADVETIAELYDAIEAGPNRKVVSNNS